MRLAGLTLAAALAAASPAAASQPSVRMMATGTVPVAPLSADEVLLELEVTGMARTPGDVARILIPVSRTGATAAEARSALDAETGRILAAAGRAGVAAGDIRVNPAQDLRAGFVGNGFADEALMGVDAPGARAPQHTATASVEIRLRDPEAFRRVRDAVETAEASVPQPVFTLSDNAAALREARADALRKARAEADDYARALGMRVGRLVRVTAAGGPEHEAYFELMVMMGRDAREARTVETRVNVSAAFALVPNR
jgi:hypothetical protein